MLIPDMFPDWEIGPFGLISGQMRSISRCSSTMLKSDKVAHNHGWYNKKGQKLGWGDLALSDMVSIRDGLEPGEVFFTLGEQDSFRKFVVKKGAFGDLCETRPEEHAPGLQYVLKKFQWVILPGAIYRANDWVGDSDPEEVVRVEDEFYTITPRKKIVHLVSSQMRSD